MYVGLSPQCTTEDAMLDVIYMYVSSAFSEEFSPLKKDHFHDVQINCIIPLTGKTRSYVPPAPTI